MGEDGKEMRGGLCRGLSGRWGAAAALDKSSPMACANICSMPIFCCAENMSAGVAAGAAGAAGAWAAGAAGCTATMAVVATGGGSTDGLEPNIAGASGVEPTNPLVAESEPNKDPLKPTPVAGRENPKGAGKKNPDAAPATAAAP